MSKAIERGVSPSFTIPSGPEKKSPVVPAKPYVTKAVEAISVLRTPTILAEGLDHVEEFREASRELQSMVNANHLSNYDHTAVMQALIRNGYRDVVDNMVFPLGISLQKNKAAKVANQMVPTIPVWPTAFPANTEEEKKQKFEMNRAGSRAIVSSMQEGKTIVLYPEASRGTKPEIESVDENVHGYFRRPNMVILPVSLTGTEVALPKGEWLPNDFPITVTFGRPLYTNELLEKYKDIPHREVGKKILDDVMMEIAGNLPDCYRGIYANRV